MTSARAYQQTQRADNVSATRAHILRAARAALAEPSGELSMEAVALRAGVTRPTIYRHFGSRGALFSAVIAHVSDGYDLARAIETAVESTSIAGFVEVSTTLWANETDLIRGALRLADDPEIHVVIRGLDKSRLRDALRLARMSQSRLSTDDLARALMMLTSPSCFLFLVDELELEPDEARRLLSKMTRALVK